MQPRLVVPTGAAVVQFSSGVSLRNEKRYSRIKVRTTSQLVALLKVEERRSCNYGDRKATTITDTQITPNSTRPIHAVSCNMLIPLNARRNDTTECDTQSQTFACTGHLRFGTARKFKIWDFSGQLPLHRLPPRRMPQLPHGTQGEPLVLLGGGRLGLRVSEGVHLSPLTLRTAILAPPSGSNLVPGPRGLCTTGREAYGEIRSLYARC
jgi:hypothetical protein